MSAVSSLANFFYGLSDEMIFILAFGAIILIVFGFVIYLNLRLTRILKGTGTQSIEDTLLTLAKQIHELEEFRSDSEKYLTTVERRLRNAVQSVETVRFNPFKGTGAGGNQSFATAFLNENGDGLVISSLYASDRMSIFAKPVEKMKASFDLTEEEGEVLKKATESVQAKR
jgi:DNA gyrase/topoisomerase IV subunit A